MWHLGRAVYSISLPCHEDSPRFPTRAIPSSISLREVEYHHSFIACTRGILSRPRHTRPDRRVNSELRKQQQHQLAIQPPSSPPPLPNLPRALPPLTTHHPEHSQRVFFQSHIGHNKLPFSHQLGHKGAELLWPSWSGRCLSAQRSTAKACTHAWGLGGGVFESRPKPPSSFPRKSYL